MAKNFDIAGVLFAQGQVGVSTKRAQTTPELPVYTTSHSEIRRQTPTNGGVIKRQGRGLSAVERARLEAEGERERFKASRRVSEDIVDDDMLNTGMLTEDQVRAAKYERRLQMNRRSAAASRVRREAYIKILEKHMRILEERIFNMERQLEAARKENSFLKGLVRGHGQQASRPFVQTPPILDTARTSRDANISTSVPDINYIARRTF